MVTVKILRGLPGSGKSTYAKRIAGGVNDRIFSTDNFFYVNGEYKFDRSKLGEYHNRNFENFIKALDEYNSSDYAVFVIDNTNLTYSEMKRYIDYSINHDKVSCLSIETLNGGFQSVHLKDAEHLERMRKRFVPTSKIKEITENMVPLIDVYSVDMIPLLDVYSVRKTPYGL